MTSGEFIRAIDLTIPNGATKSNSISAKAFQGAWLGMIYGPNSVGSAGTVVLEMNPSPDAVDGDAYWATFQDAGVDWAFPAANKAKALPELAGAGSIRAVAAANPGQNVTYKITQNQTI